MVLRPLDIGGGDPHAAFGLAMVVMMLSARGRAAFAVRKRELAKETT
jgi:hypothetical protein